jgi:hypothetical protein
MKYILEFIFTDLLKFSASILLLSVAFKIYRVKLHIEGTSPCCKWTSDNQGGRADLVNGIGEDI